jgi:hypothetical protein
MKAEPTGSPGVAKGMGIVVVAAFAANAAGRPPHAKITKTNHRSCYARACAVLGINTASMIAMRNSAGTSPIK